MSNELWGVGPDARRAARSVVLSASLGVAAFAITFSAALMLGRGLVGSALAALLLPLAVSGGVAVGLAAAFVVATALEQPAGRRRVARLVGVVTPIAALVALLVYTADPTADLGRAIGGPDFPIAEPATPRPRRTVGVPAPPPVVTTPPVPTGPGTAPDPVAPDPVVPEPVSPEPPATGDGTAGAPPVNGPVVPPVTGPGDAPVGPVLPDPAPRPEPEEPPREIAEPGTETPREPEDLSPRPPPRRDRAAKPAKKAERTPAACGTAKAAPKGAAKGRPAKTRPPAGRPAACYR